MDPHAQIHDIRVPDLQEKSTKALQSIYLELIGNRPPHKASARFLRGNIAWFLQIRESGVDAHSVRCSLIEKLSRAGKDPTPIYQPGTRLVREWQGDTHEVIIRETDYLWQGRAYASLSAIATEMTGTRWSGHRFFGLKATRS